MSPRLNKTRVMLAGGALLLASQLAAPAEADIAPASHDANANPYSIIVDRNVFRLNPPPPPPAKDAGPPPDLPQVILSGFDRKGDQWQVLLAVRTKTGGPPPNEITSYLTMTEGDKDGVVELVKAYPDEDKIEIINSGNRMTLTMKDNGWGSVTPTPPVGGPRGNPAVRQLPGAVPVMAPLAVPVPVVPGLGAVDQNNGMDPTGFARTMVGGAGVAPIPVNAGNSFVGGAGGVPGAQPNTAAYQPGFNGRSEAGVLSAGGLSLAVPKVAAEIVEPLPSVTSLSRLTQPNSTPIGGPVAPGTPMPPMPPMPGQ